MNLKDNNNNGIVETIIESAEMLIIDNLIGDNHRVKIELYNSSLLDVLKGESNAEDIGLKVSYYSEHDFNEVYNDEENSEKMLELCDFEQINEDDFNLYGESFTNNLTSICGCKLTQFIEKFPVSSRIENSNNPSNVCQIWKSYISDWSSAILEHLEQDYPSDITAENFSVCALENWNYASKNGGDDWIDELGDTHSEVITHPEDILWFKSIAIRYFENIDL